MRGFVEHDRRAARGLVVAGRELDVAEDRVRDLGFLRVAQLVRDLEASRGGRARGVPRADADVERGLGEQRLARPIGSRVVSAMSRACAK